ncbi:hypothetical protein [Conexibacter arvalis]|uniref:Uncharacterized protein n=1 Tax=Conexibacter arvalis TaxID=912552 RepID=A0A840IHB3_9ACTN|nr:hypothetical protein [Conexibacter arvalis]MBB4663715.1 hypothetical protein [Conexibacter arvalis]
MSFDPTRLRRGEWIAGAGGVLLLVSLFLFDWYGASADLGNGFSFSVGANGWETHSILRWLMLLTIVAGVALWLLTATQPTDAIPLSAAVVTVVVAGITTLCLAWRVLVNEPGPNALIEVKAGAWIGLVAAALVVVGAWLSMRDEDRRGPLPDVPVRPLA